MNKPTDAPRRSIDNSAGEITREKLLLAAEELVADVGVGNASARQIARLAGLKNNVSVQYHFGSLDKLLEEVVAHRMAMSDRIRTRMIEQIGSENFDSLTVEQLWEIICVPQLELRGAGGRYQYAMFLCNYLPVKRPEGFSWIIRASSDRTPALRKVLQRLREVLIEMPTEAFHRRVTSANLLFLNTCRGLKPVNPAEGSVLDQNAVARDAFRQSVASLTVPWIP